MPLTKNQLVTLSIESLSSDGSGVAHCDGQAVFVPGAAPGDVAAIRIIKPMKSYAFGRLERLLTPGPGRVPPDCKVCVPCGGCSLRHLSYEAECAAKTTFVQDAFTRLGGLTLAVEPILPSPLADRYRNKVQLPVGAGEDGLPQTGFFAGRSHRIIPCPDCKLQPEWMNELATRTCALFAKYGVTSYDEERLTGHIRHLYIRQGWQSGQRLLCFVVNGRDFPHAQEIAATLQQEFALTTVLLNQNGGRTNVILGSETRTLFGPGVVEDVLAGVPLKMGVHEFYQVNTPAAEVLYAKIREFAALRPTDFLLDLYCGMGTIGLSMQADCARLVGVELVPQAVEEAKATAARLGLAPERATFYCIDAGQAAAHFAEAGEKPDVIVLDPPRKGCDLATLDAVLAMAPRTVVMVSCNAATAARDVKYLAQNGYQPQKIQPVDLFPRTKHVESIVLLARAE
ncbi:MAG: 23S rRNA (uracil(1939)-C(5))-methyltransferase RlmD [Gemmiger sp.]|nr:23S rRNA (uracil(1939)-C(5))-methyltransferase RlmD [Gemmiger sp.]